MSITYVVLGAYLTPASAARRRYCAAMLDPTDATLAAYEKGIEAYCAASPAAVAPHVASWLDAVVEAVPGGRLLELGSGPGIEADYLEQRGLSVERTDGTRAFVDRLRRGGHEARVLDVRSGLFGGPFDAVLAHAVLLHVARDQMEQVLRAAHAATRPGGVLALSVKEGDGEAWSHAKLDQPRWFVYWRPQPLRTVLERTGWQVVRLEQVAGRPEPRLQALCRR